MNGRRPFLNLLQEFSVPLLAGVAVAMLVANLAPDSYAQALHWAPLGERQIFGHRLDLHFLVNDIFMLFFFGIAAKEITEACLPGGSLNPPHKAVNPLFATIGGVIGPALVFFLALWLCFELGFYSVLRDDYATLSRGWGIPTATDIALAWLVARSVFPRGHPAVVFLLLLAVADDAIGLMIIAVFYGDPTQPMAWGWLLISGTGVALAASLRAADVRKWQAYVMLAGPLVWSGLVLAHLHPALALVFVVPFMPAPRRDTGLFEEADEVDYIGADNAEALAMEHSTLHVYEEQTKGFVDFGLFFFAFANAGVEIADVGGLTWIVLGALVVGKTVGISTFGWLAMRIGSPLPAGMTMADLMMAGFIASLGLTVALFVASAAYLDPALQGQAKMGALLSGGVGLVAVALGRALGFGSERPAAPVARGRPTRDSDADGILLSGPQRD